ncbi:MAG: hypothetical protein VX223_10650 [Myxococcota bacterium]|nr:hypothetical protein [Myxococcota bacterium]
MDRLVHIRHLYPQWLAPQLIIPSSDETMSTPFAPICCDDDIAQTSFETQERLHHATETAGALCPKPLFFPARSVPV